MHEHSKEFVTAFKGVWKQIHDSIDLQARAITTLNMQQPNHVNIGEHAPLPPPSHERHGSASSGEKVQNVVRRTPSEPVTSEDGPEDLQTREHGRQSVPAPTALGFHIPEEAVIPTTLPTPTVHDLSFDVQLSMKHFLEPDGPEIAECFERAVEYPPITHESLAELDMPRIINNPKLRHDVNFDRDLHFRPNLDGSKGREKIRLAEEYWKALEGELFMYGFVHKRRTDPLQSQDEAYWTDILSVSRRRLPKIFDAVREILKTLVPDYDQGAVMERLDVELIMQEIENGVCDLIDLANWLGRILKNHCAPMRDAMVDRMQAEIKRGAAMEQPATLVNGIRQLLNILEAMKLDVANHQIRHMRPLLIEDTVNFQRRYNAHRISLNKIDVPRSRLWLEYEMAHLTTDIKTPTHVEGLTSALLRGLMFAENAQHPQTFYLDADRLRMLSIELQSRVYQEICRDALVEMCPQTASRTDLVHAITGLHMSVSAIVGVSGRFADRLENIAAEIMRFLLVLEGRRDPSFDSTLLAFVEQRLQADFLPTSIVFEKHAMELFERIMPKLEASIDQHIKLSALHLQDRLVPPAPLPLQQQPLGMGAVCGPPDNSTTDSDPDEDVVRKLTHIIILHWQVWADLVYLAPPEEDHDTPASNDYTPPSSASTSPTIPVAQAVYAPGRKWLPIGITVTEVPSGLPTPAPSPLPNTHSSPSNNEQSDGSSSEHSSLDSEQQQST